MIEMHNDRADANIRLSPYVMRFVLVFVAMSVAAILINSWFKITGNAGLAIGILVASTIPTGQKFINDTKRVFIGDEKLKMAFYCMLVSLIVSLVLFAAHVLLSGFDPRVEIVKLFQIWPVWMQFATAFFAAALNFGLLYLSFSFVIGKVFNGMVKRGEIK